MHFYALSYEELLRLPMATFWMLNANIDRLRADADLRLLNVSRAAQAPSDQVTEFTDLLVTQIASPVTFVSDPTQATPEDGYKNKLMDVMRRLNG